MLLINCKYSWESYQVVIKTRNRDQLKRLNLSKSILRLIVERNDIHIIDSSYNIGCVYMI